MEQLIEDVQIEIFSYLYPEEIISFHQSCDNFKQIIKSLSHHKGFVVKCTKIIQDETVSWFQQNQIQLKLLEELKCKEFYCLWYLNGKQHRDNDLPANVFHNRSKCWYQNGLLHRDNDLPAIVRCDDGCHVWYKNGLIHRDNDLPAIIFADDEKQEKQWYRNGLLHRDNDLPAYENGDKKVWYQNDKMHRDYDLPAVIYANGNKAWHLNGKLHRDNDLPALICENGHMEWYKNGIRI